MAIPQYADRVQELTTTTGLGAYTLEGAILGYQTFSLAIGAGTQCYYLAYACDVNGVAIGPWEVGLGTIVGNTLTRDQILASSQNRTDPINWGVGPKRLSVNLPASQIARPMSGWADVPFNAADFTSNAGSWTMTAAAVLVNKYILDGNVLFWQFSLSWWAGAGTNVIAGAPTQLKIRTPGGVRTQGPANGFAIANSGPSAIGFAHYLTHNGDGFTYVIKIDGSAFVDGPVGLSGAVWLPLHG